MSQGNCIITLCILLFILNKILFRMNNGCLMLMSGIEVFDAVMFKYHQDKVRETMLSRNSNAIIIFENVKLNCLI